MCLHVEESGGSSSPSTNRCVTEVMEGTVR